MEQKNSGMRHLFIMVSSAVMLAACASAPRSDLDNRIEASAKDSYAYRTYLQGDNITIRSENGKVTLTGDVPDVSHRILAEETVADLPGVRGIDNRLQVTGGTPSEGSDAWIAAQVKAELLTHRDVSAVATKVDVKDGVVTLSGQAKNEAQKELTAEYAKDVKGVKGVINNLTLAGAPASQPKTLGQQVDDTSITAQVKLTLMTHRATSALNTQVDTNNGIVTVHGIAANQAQKDLVTKLITDVNGVKGVDNEMTLETPASYTP